jgi:hypothetical protein
LADRVLALLDHLVDDARDRCIVECDAFVDLTLLDRGQQQANRGQAARFARAHGGFHVVVDAIFQTHLSPECKKEQLNGITQAQPHERKNPLGTFPQAGFAQNACKRPKPAGVRQINRIFSEASGCAGA